MAKIEPPSPGEVISIPGAGPVVVVVVVVVVVEEGVPVVVEVAGDEVHAASPVKRTASTAMSKPP